MLIDLHIHTSASDGNYTPAEMINFAKDANLKAIAITDHDTINGIKAAQLANTDGSIEIIPGIELSAEYNNEDFHILGYFLDITNKEFLTKLNELTKKRQERVNNIVSKLHNLGINLDLTTVYKIANNSVIGRPHIAKAMIELGIVKTKEEAFTKYLGTGKPAYVPLISLTPIEAVQLILLATGVPVLAHPGTNKNFIILLPQLITNGLKGIEVYHPKHTKKQIKQYLKIAKKNDLIITGGTDFHGDYASYVNILQTFPVNYTMVEALKYVKMLTNNKI